MLEPGLTETGCVAYPLYNMTLEQPIKANCIFPIESPQWPYESVTSLHKGNLRLTEGGGQKETWLAIVWRFPWPPPWFDYFG